LRGGTAVWVVVGFESAVEVITFVWLMGYSLRFGFGVDVKVNGIRCTIFSEVVVLRWVCYRHYNH